DFWAANHDAPWLLAHPYRSQLDLNRTIPIFIHGDDAESHRRRSFMVVAGGWKAVLACHKGDEAYLQKAYNMVTTWNSESVCWRCG
ncbi:unnamed protein product, partial [Effrenium voratum]